MFVKSLHFSIITISTCEGKCPGMSRGVGSVNILTRYPKRTLPILDASGSSVGGCLPTGACITDSPLESGAGSGFLFILINML